MSHHKGFSACGQCASEADLFSGLVTHDRCPHRTARIEGGVPQTPPVRCANGRGGSHRGAASERQLV